MGDDVKIYYSIKKKGFYPSNVAYAELPDDLKEISMKDYEEFFSGKEGYSQVFDENGPRLVKIPTPDPSAPVEPTMPEQVEQMVKDMAQVANTLKMNGASLAEVTGQVSTLISGLDALKKTVENLTARVVALEKKTVSIKL